MESCQPAEWNVPCAQQPAAPAGGCSGPLGAVRLALGSAPPGRRSGASQGSRKVHAPGLPPSREERKDVRERPCPSTINLSSGPGLPVLGYQMRHTRLGWAVRSLSARFENRGKESYYLYAMSSLVILGVTHVRTSVSNNAIQPAPQPQRATRKCAERRRSTHARTRASTTRPPARSM
jgi:hypothetical protein